MPLQPNNQDTTTGSKDISMNFKTLIYGIIIIVGLTLTGLFIWDLSRKDALTEYNKQFRAYQDSVVSPALKRSDSLSTLAKLTLDSANALSDSSAVITRKLQMLQTINTNLRTQNIKLVNEFKSSSDTTCTLCTITINSLVAEVDTLKSTVNSLEHRDSLRVAEIQKLHTSLLFQTARGDSLSTVIVNWPVPPAPKKFFGLSLTKKQTFIVGTVVGIGSTILARKAVSVK